MLESLNEEMFARQLHTKFLLYPEPERTVELELIEVSGDALQKRGGGEHFSLIFRGPGDAFLPQSTYRMEHDEMGAFDLFIVPVGKDNQGFQYQAIFNRLAS